MLEGGSGREFWAGGYEVFGDSGARGGGRQGNRQTAVGRDLLNFGSEVGMVMALARHSSVVPSLSVAVPLMLPALPPALVVVASVAVGSPSWCSKAEETERGGGRVG